MSETILKVFDSLLTASVGMALAAIFVGTSIRLLKIWSPRWQQFAWGCVLCHGVLIAKLPIAFPERAASPLPIAASAVGESERQLSSLIPDDNSSTAAVHYSSQTAIFTKSNSAIATQITADPPDSRPWNWRVATMVVWICGAAIGIVLGAYRYRHFVSNLGNLRPAEPEWRSEWESLLDESGVRRRIPLEISDSAGPMLCMLPGGLRVVVPADRWHALTSAERLAVLQHELVHYRHFDLWKLLVARLLVQAHWFNPFAWWSLRRFETCGEWRCDELATRGAPSTELARALMRLGSARTHVAPLSNAAATGPLFARIQRLLAPDAHRDHPSRVAMLWLLSIALFGVGLVRIEPASALEPSNPPEFADGETIDGTRPPAQAGDKKLSGAKGLIVLKTDGVEIRITENAADAPGAGKRGSQSDGFQRFRFTEESIKQALFGNSASPMTMREELEKTLRKKVAILANSYKLSDLQKTKMELAGQEDIDRLFERMEKIRPILRRVEFAANDKLAAAARLIDETRPLRGEFRSGPFGGNSNFERSLGVALTAEQTGAFEFLRNLERIDSFDVYLTVSTVTRAMMLEADGPAGESGRLEWRRLPAGNEVRQRVAFRQVFDRAGPGGRSRHRLEEFRPDSSQPESIRTSDGDVRQSYYRAQKSGLIGPSRSTRDALADNENDYNYCLGMMWHGTPLAELLRERRAVAKKDGDLIRLDAPPDSEFRTIPAEGYRAWLDPARGMCMTRFEYFEVIPTRLHGADLSSAGGDGKEVLCSSFVVDDFHSPQPGLWVPIRVTAKTYVSRGAMRGELLRESEIFVDSTCSRWNAKIDDLAFAIDFAPGTRVHDERRIVDTVIGDMP